MNLAKLYNSIWDKVINDSYTGLFDKDDLLKRFDEQLKANDRVIIPHNEMVNFKDHPLQWPSKSMPQCPTGEGRHDSSDIAIAQKIAQTQGIMNRMIVSHRGQDQGGTWAKW